MSAKLASAFAELDLTLIEAGKLELALVEFHSGNSAIDGVMGWLMVQGIAAAIEKIYSGCERVLLAIAREVDGQQPEKDHAWHRQLLLQMAAKIEGVRPPLLSQKVFDHLNNLRSFRHRVRNSYGSDFDGVRVVEIAHESIVTARLLMKDLDLLEKHLAA